RDRRRLADRHQVRDPQPREDRQELPRRRVQPDHRGQVVPGQLADHGQPRQARARAAAARDPGAAGERRLLPAERAALPQGPEARGRGRAAPARLTSLYFAQGVPYGFFTQALPVLLRERGLSLAAIGASGFLFLPWALKFLWAPLVDHTGTRKQWIVAL